MLSIRSETLALLRATLDHIEENRQGSVLASQEDCDYFRKQYLPPTPVVKPPAPRIPKPVETPILKTEPVKPIEAPVKLPEPAAPVKQSPSIAKPDLAPIGPAAPENFGELRKIWAKIAPGAPLFEEIPNDETAKKIANRWKTKNLTAEISILAYHEPPAQKALLEQIAKAIDAVFGSARIVQAEPIEKEKQWEAFLSVPHLRLTIACDYTLWQLGGLMQHYREVPAQGKRHLGSVPVFLLPDLSLYLKDPLLKRSLWKALCQTLS